MKKKKRNICFLTLAKENSNRLKNKNILTFSGYPLIHWTISKIKKISKNHYINSDSEFILNYAKKLKVKTIKRTAKLCGDNIPSRHLLLDSFNYFPQNTYAVIHVQANSPNLQLSKIKKVYDLLMYTDIEDVFSMTSNGKINGSIWGITYKKLKKYNFNKKIHDHKSLTNECWIIDDSIDIHTKHEFVKAQKLFNKNI
jgi:CMP-N-acetylneuraminic acid synthetase